nr:Peptidase A24, N-terminal domain protein [Leptospira interrogans serovar Copenhageni/Icterohaemorrhagiae]
MWKKKYVIRNYFQSSVFFISKGTCKYCNKKIYILFPLVEFLFVCIFVFCFTITKNLSFSFTFLFLCGHLLISCLTDAFHFSLDYENLPWILCFGVISIFLLDGKLPSLNDLFVLGGFFFHFLGFIFFSFRAGLDSGTFYSPQFMLFIAGHPWWMFFFKRFLYSCRFIYNHSQRKREKYS